ncbi:hypothetical protein D3C81_11490 [compost metagenome]
MFNLNRDAAKANKPKKVKKVSKSNSKIKYLVIGISAALLINIGSAFTLRQKVEVVKLKIAVPQDGRLTEENFVKDTMTKSEYEKSGNYTTKDGAKKRAIVLWNDRSRIVNAYASNYIRQGTPIYWDSLSGETPKRYSYLYKMDGELLKLDIKADQFGTMLVPGDKINIRATYDENNYTLPDDEQFELQQQAGIRSETSIKRQVKLFNDVVVLDILNSKGESIFDLYYDLLTLNKTAQLNKLGSAEFQDQVKPAQILLNVTPEEADDYMRIQSKGPSYMMTLLPRTSGNLITEALNELQTGLARQQSSSNTKK